MKYFILFLSLTICSNAFSQLDLNSVSFSPLEKLPGEIEMSGEEKYEFLKKVLKESGDTNVVFILQSYDCLIGLKDRIGYRGIDPYKTIHIIDYNGDNKNDCVIDNNSSVCAYSHSKLYYSKDEKYIAINLGAGTITSIDSIYNKLQIKTYACCDDPMNTIDAHDLLQKDNKHVFIFNYPKEYDTLFVNISNYKIKEIKTGKKEVTVLINKESDKSIICRLNSKIVSVIIEEKNYLFVIIESVKNNYNHHSERINYPAKYFVAGWVKKKDL